MARNECIILLFKLSPRLTKYMCDLPVDPLQHLDHLFTIEGIIRFLVTHHAVPVDSLVKVAHLLIQNRKVVGKIILILGCIFD